MRADVRAIPAPLAAAAADEVRALADSVKAHDGVEAFGEAPLLQLTDPASAAVHLGARGPGEVLVGYAQLDPATGSAELAVLPAHRRRGTGRALLDALRSARQDADAPPLSVWAHGSTPAARALAASAGMTVQRELWQMSRALGPADARSGALQPTAPAGVTLRPFVVGQDEAAWLDLNARAFADHPEQGRMTLRDLHARQAEPWFRAEDLLLAERDGRLVGSAWMKVEPGSTSGELYALAVDPQTQGSGIGRYLTSQVLAHLARSGLRSATLYVEGSSEVAVRTYASAGFEPTRIDVQYR